MMPNFLPITAVSAVILLTISCSVFSAVPAVRNAQNSHPPAVRDANVGGGPLRDDSSNVPTIGDSGVNPEASNGGNNVVNPEGPQPVTIIATATSQPEVPQPVPNSRPVSVNAAPNVAPAVHHRPNSLSEIGHQFAGGLGAIRDSAGNLIGLGVDTAIEGVASVVRPVVAGVAFVVRPVVQVAENVVNRTVFIGSQLASSGHQIAGAWGNSLQQTKNITGQLVDNVVGRR